MEPIRYLQPATFPPPAFNCSAVKSVLRSKKCNHDNNSNKNKDDESGNNNSKQPSTCITGSNCSSSETHTNKITHSSNQQQSQYPHFYRQHYRVFSSILWFLAFVILILCSCCNQAVQASPVFVDNPNLAQFQTGRNIRHLPCIVRKSGLSGTCMFAIDCIKQNGTHLGTCIDRFYFGSCCQIKEENQDFAPEISDNSIDQNTILHFVPEATTLPASALYKTTTENPHFKNNISYLNNQHKTHIKQPITSLPTTAITANTLSAKPTKVTSTATTTHQTKRPLTNINTTHKNSQFVVRTTKKPTTTKATLTTRNKPTTTTTTTTKTTQQPITVTTQTTRKPPRRKPTTTTTTTTPPPVLTTAGPRVPSSDETTTSPPKLFTFQMVETTAQTDSTNFIDFTTLPPSTVHHNRPQSTTQEHKASEITNIITTIETSTTKVKPSQPMRHTSQPKPITSTKLPATTTTVPLQAMLTTEKIRKPAPTKKNTTKHPKPTIQPIDERPKPTLVSTTFKPLPLADEIPPTVITHQKPSTTSANHIHTTYPQTTRPKPTATVTKTPSSTIITTTTPQHKRPTPETTFITKRPATKKPSPTTATKATTTTLPPSKIASTSTTTTSSAPASVSSTTFKPGLITWTNEGAEPIINATSTADQQQWLPVPTIAPVTSASNKNEITSAAPMTPTSTSTIFTTTSSTKTTLPPIIASSTEKIIVSVSSSVSEVHQNETRRPVRPQTPSATTEATKLPTTPVKPSLSATTPTQLDVETTTFNFEGTVDSSTDRNWGSVTTGFMTMTDGVTEDYNATMMMGTSIATTLQPTSANLFEGIDYREICGRRMFPEPKIVGGSNSAFGRWPWQISLRQWRTSTYLHKCGAALLNENWAITAAHCVDNVPPSDLLLRLGEYDLAEEEEPYGYQERRVQIVASHPQFDPRTFEYDLALLRFYEPVVFQPNIIPVCVPNSDDNFIGQTAFVTGWGRLYEDGPLPSVLQEVAVPIINNSICETMYGTAGYIEHIPHIFICAGWKKGGYDSCEGDSGGPMVLQREDDKRFVLGGVISWGIGCAEANQPGVYTRISEFRDWINQILQF